MNVVLTTQRRRCCSRGSGSIPVARGRWPCLGDPVCLSAPARSDCGITHNNAVPFIRTAEQPPNEGEHEIAERTEAQTDSITITTPEECEAKQRKKNVDLNFPRKKKRASFKQRGNTHCPCVVALFRSDAEKVTGPPSSCQSPVTLSVTHLSVVLLRRKSGFPKFLHPFPLVYE